MGTVFLDVLEWSRGEGRMRKAKRLENSIMFTTGQFLDFSSLVLIPQALSEVWKELKKSWALDN